MTVKRTKKTMSAKGSPAGQKEANTELSISDQHISSLTLKYFQRSGMSKLVPQSCSNISGFYSHFFANFIKVNLIKRGRISCTVSVKPQISVTPFSPLFFFLIMHNMFMIQELRSNYFI